MARRSLEVVGLAKPDMRAVIAERAYYLAERRGFEPGHEVDDWLAAEREIAALASGPRAAAAPKKPRRKNGATAAPK
ncbi:MAG TPA: DUF2934 domain-containing protein [Gammaproteobacteria bacterium]|nr:DUF2934 domain-containing protein [Gammaproteobacteria bacterium]